MTQLALNLASPPRRVPATGRDTREDRRSPTGAAAAGDFADQAVANLFLGVVLVCTALLESSEAGGRLVFSVLLGSAFIGFAAWKPR